MKFSYEIDDNNEIRIWDEDNPNLNNAPFCYQPWWPLGAKPFAGKEEATSWAKIFIESLINPDSEYLPGNSPEEPKRLRIDPAEVINEEPV